MLRCGSSPHGRVVSTAGQSRSCRALPRRAGERCIHAADRRRHTCVCRCPRDRGIHLQRCDCRWHGSDHGRARDRARRPDRRAAARVAERHTTLKAGVSRVRDAVGARMEHPSASPLAASVKGPALAENPFVRERRALRTASCRFKVIGSPGSVGVSAALLLAVAVVAGCGGTSASAGSVATGTGTAYARAVNLRAGDVPGSVVGRVWERGVAVGLERERLATTGPFDAWIERCDGGVTIVPSQEVVGLRSPHFTRGLRTAPPSAEGAWSVVFVFASEAAAKHELSVLASVRAKTCFRRDGDTSVPGSETHLEVSTVQAAPGFAVHGVSWSAVPSSYRPPSRRYQDLLFFTSGRALITLHTIAAPRPFKARLEAQLLRLLYSRAAAHGPS